MGRERPQQQPAALPDNRRVGTVFGSRPARQWAGAMQLSSGLHVTACSLRRVPESEELGSLSMSC